MLYDEDGNDFPYGIPIHREFAIDRDFTIDRGFIEQYKCFPVIMMQGNEREEVNYGGKIILPQSALMKLANLNIQYPMLFKLENINIKLHTHAGVLEFIAEEGRVYLPQWMMQTLHLKPGDLINVYNASLQLGSFVKIQPQSVNFLDISDPKAVLELRLRNFSTLTRDDIIQIEYNNVIYEIRVLEIRPETHHGGVSIVETDLEVDFAPPLGYVEPTRPMPHSMIDGPRMAIDQPVQQQKTFAGLGMRLNGKATEKELAQPMTEPAAAQDEEETPAPLDLPFGQLFFGYPVVPIKPKEQEEAGAANGDLKTAFAGQGQVLRMPRNTTATDVPGSPAIGPSQSPRVQPAAEGEVEPFKGKGNRLK